MLHRKPHIESHLRSTEKLLAEHLKLLTTNGEDSERIIKNSQVRHLKAKIRQAKKQLATIASLETQMAEKVETRTRKEAAAKSEEPHGKPRKKDRNAPPAKKRKKPRIEMEEGAQTE